MRLVSALRLRRRVASFVRNHRHGSRPPLIILPSTAHSLELAGRLSRAMPVGIIGNPRLMADWAPGLSAQVKSPLGLWKDAKARTQLPYAVISYPDQLVGTDSSFQKIPIGDRHCTFSIVEMMLAMKFHPPIYLGTPRFRGRGEKASSTLRLQPFVGDVPAGLPRQEFDEWLARLMQPVITCIDEAHDGWLAREVFRLRLDDNFETMLKLRLLEIEGLLRLGDDLSASRHAYSGIRDELQCIRRKPLLLAGSP